MPGLFDNNGGGILRGLGNYLQDIAGATSPANQEVLFRQRARDALAQQNSPADADILMGSPQAYGLGFQRQLFLDQLRDLQSNNPGMSLNEALYWLSPEGQKQAFGITPVPGFKTPSGAEAPGTIQRGQVMPPPGMGFSGPGAPTGTASVQPQPSQQPGQPTPLSPMDQAGIKYKTDLAGGEELARKQADALQQYPNALTAARDAVARLEALRDNPNLGSVVGGPLGLKGRTAALGQGQADLVNEISELQGKIIGNVLSATRSVSGRPINPGTLKELTAGAGDLISARKGTVEGMKTAINNSIDLIKKETQAAWEGTGKKGTEPIWGQAKPIEPQQYQEGTIARNKQTGETRILRAGRWVAP